MVMKDKNTKNLFIIFMVICFVFLSILIATHYTTTEKNQNENGFAIVRFSLSNKSSVEFLCEIASTPQQRSQGLMNRTKLPNDQGMLFVFDTPQIVTFWMKNTVIALDIIFLNETGIVINIESADVELGITDNNLTRYSSIHPAKFVIEINQGLSTKHGITKGTAVFIEYL